MRSWERKNDEAGKKADATWELKKTLWGASSEEKKMKRR